MPSDTAAHRPDAADWWRSAVIYQVYIRSFADGDGDGVGDIAGIRSRLPYLAGLGVDALWINPWYPSPMADAGYDVSDYRAIEPVFGSLDEATALIEEAHAAGLRVLLDIVPNHTSSAHAWFARALTAGPGSPERARFLFRPGRGEHGELPPNNWPAMFGGPAWARVTEPDGSPGEWYLHLFAPEQPDLDWTNTEVRADFEDTLRFWFDRGVDGFRIDVAHGLAKAAGLPDQAEDPTAVPAGAQPQWDRDEVHEIYRDWRKIADSYDPPRIFVAEAWVASPERRSHYVRPDELHTAFDFDFVVAPFLAPQLRRAIEESVGAIGAVGAPTTWVLANHDVVREVTRYARPQPDHPIRRTSDLGGQPADLALGRRRARAAALLLLALPGGAYVYQGEELGLEEVEDLPDDARQDPVWFRSGHTRKGRDGCRVPLPWSGDAPPYGFSPAGATGAPWLPQPADWAGFSVAAERGDPGSMLELYRRAIALRREHPALGDGTMAWQSSADDVLLFTREPGFGCLVNISGGPVRPPAGARPLLASGDLDPDGSVPADTAIWFATDGGSSR